MEVGGSDGTVDSQDDCTLTCFLLATQWRHLPTRESRSVVKDAVGAILRVGDD